MTGQRRIYIIKLNLESSAHQPELMQLLKTQGDEVIQTSDGLCVKSSMSEGELKKAFEEKNLAGGITIVKVESTEGLTPNVQAFIG